MRLMLVLLGLWIATPALASSNMPPAYWADRQLEDPRLEAQAQSLMQELRCLVCQGQSIADSDADMAGDMRDLVRRRIAQGETPSQIRSWLVERYGPWVTYRPPAQPMTWPLWLAPLVLLAGGLLIARTRLKGRASE